MANILTVCEKGGDLLEGGFYPKNIKRPLQSLGHTVFCCLSLQDFMTNKSLPPDVIIITPQEGDRTWGIPAFREQFPDKPILVLAAFPSLVKPWALELGATGVVDGLAITMNGGPRGFLAAIRPHIPKENAEVFPAPGLGS